ncbi:hypothetical protein [Corynebacterium sp. CCM 9204]|uniref:8-oxoguanine DNA glycosylase OGG fold protein n=1 Tax=Corynebacterium sp. CCM 9204 TaxID=3057616 RepID=UPI00352573F2
MELISADLDDLVTKLESTEHQIHEELMWTDDERSDHSRLAELVSRQRERFRPSDWIGQWDKDPDPVPFPPPPFLTDQPDHEYLSVTRERLFELGENICDGTETDVLNFYVAVYAWGAAQANLQIYRGVQPLKDPRTPGRLLAGLRAGRESAEAGYRAFHTGGAAKIHKLGPSFFTKLLYFAAGRSAPSDERHPLILDSRVANALGWNTTDGWSVAQYARYLDTVRVVREHWGREDLPTDVIEYLLFQADRFPYAPSI